MREQCIPTLIIPSWNCSNWEIHTANGIDEVGGLWGAEGIGSGGGSWGERSAEGDHAMLIAIEIRRKCRYSVYIVVIEDRLNGI